MGIPPRGEVLGKSVWKSTGANKSNFEKKKRGKKACHNVTEAALRWLSIRNERNRSYISTRVFRRKEKRKKIGDPNLERRTLIEMGSAAMRKMG